MGPQRVLMGIIFLTEAPRKVKQGRRRSSGQGWLTSSRPPSRLELADEVARGEGPDLGR